MSVLDNNLLEQKILDAGDIGALPPTALLNPPRGCCCRPEGTRSLLIQPRSKG